MVRIVQQCMWCTRLSVTYVHRMLLIIAKDPKNQVNMRVRTILEWQWYHFIIEWYILWVVKESKAYRIHFGFMTKMHINISTFSIRIMTKDKEIFSFSLVKALWIKKQIPEATPNEFEREIIIWIPTEKAISYNLINFCRES